MVKAGRLEDAAEAFERALELDPDLKAAQDGLVQLAEKQKSISSPLTGSKQPITLKFQNARTKEVFEVLARAGGINVLFEKDMKDDPITIFVTDASFEEALNLILANDRKPGEVMFEIEVLEVDRTLSDRFGVNIAKQASAGVVPSGTTPLPLPGATTPFTFQELTSIGTGSYLFTLPTSVLLDFLRSESATKTLANPRVRVVNNKQAKIN